MIDHDSGSASSFTFRAAPLVAACLLAGCFYPAYVAQGAVGQLDLLARARPLDDVIRDPKTPLRTALELSEIPAIKTYGRSYGLRIRRNYETYADIGRGAAVWFVGASDPLAFKPRQWCFPIVGCFAGVGYFDEDEAIRFEQQLEAQGYDALVRPASAYSTSGWFHDPVLSTMLGAGDDALPELADVILHESVHATVFVPDEPFFNESFAEYTADALTDHWITMRFGPGSPEDIAWTLGEALRYPRIARTLKAHKDLEAVYKDPKLSRAAKLAAKTKIIDDLVTDLHQRRRPNNASLTEAAVYNGGAAALLAAHRGCGDLRSMVEAGKTLKRSDFTQSLQSDLTPIATLLVERCRLKTGHAAAGSSR
ncbi:MAG TPA: aminopeptidase [Kofleriaceae bacterium]